MCGGELMASQVDEFSSIFVVSPVIVIDHLTTGGVRLYTCEF